MKKFLALLLSAMMVLSCFAGMTFTISAEETTEPTIENLVIPQDQWTVSGHCPQIVQKTGHANSPMVAAGGIDSGALLHQGAVGIGEIDLSKYSKVIIKYGIDNSEVTFGHYNASANNRIMLSKVDNNMKNAPADEDIIASKTYTLEGWGIVPIEIDLTDVDYNGPVYITYDTLPGTFMLIGAVEFVPVGVVEEEPEFEEKTIVLGKGAQGGPFSGAPKYNFGQRYNIGDDVLSNVSILAMATYSDGGVNKWNFKVWQWNTDYATTVAGTPLFNQDGENHQDNQTFSIDIPTELDIRGDIYYEITYVEGPGPDKTFTGWIAADGPAEGVETYVAGEQRTDGTYRATLKVIGLPLPPDPNEESTECLFSYDFSKYSENFTADHKVGNPNETVITELCNSGYVTLESKGGDPYFILGNAPTVPASQSDYVVIKYRTSTAKAAGEIYTGRSDGLNWAAPMEKTHVDLTYVADGQWHTLIVDASGVWGDSKDASLTNFRFDFLKSVGTIDVSYIKFFATLEGAEACVAAETKEVTLSGEYIEGDDAIIIVGGGAYSADKWVKLSTGGAPAIQSFAGDISKFSICADNVRYSIGGTQTDWCTQEAHNYMASIEGKIKDAESAYEYISFRGWANPTVGGLEIAEFGYAINNQEPVFSADFAIDEPTLNEALGSAAARRFENIIIPTAGLANGVYNIYLLVKDTEGTVYCMNGNFGGDILFIKGNAAIGESDYPYVDAEGNGYTVRADGVIFDANGFDTGMHLFVADDGTPYGAAHYFALEYQDPAAGAVEIDGVKYTYTTKITLAPKMEPVDPDNEIVTATYDPIATHVSTDTIYIGSKIVASGPEVPAYIIGANSILRDTDKIIETMTFRGWIGHNESPVAQFGYAFDNAEPVWGEFKEATEDPVLAAGGGPNSQRFAIKVDISGLSEAKHSLYLLVKYEDGTIVTMNNIWTNLIIVKGGSWKQVGYTDGNITYVKSDDGTVSVNGEAGTGKMLVTDDGAIYYDGVAALDDNAKGKYLYNVTLTYTVDPEIPVNPSKLVPVYLIDGEMLNVTGGQGIADATYDYEAGCITYTATAPDPNTHGQNFVPAGTILGRYLVLKYRTSSEGAQGECFVGTGVGASGPDNVRYPAYITDGEWHTLIADLSVSKEWSPDGLTNHFRNDILIDKDHSIDIEYYAFFNTMKEATYYAENDCHVLPKAPVYYTITFKADGEVVKEITILEGTTSIKEPKVPEKEGYTGAWAEYTITGDQDQVIEAVYTKIGGSDEEYKVDDPTKLTTFPEDVFKSYFTGPNQTEIIYNEDGSVTFKGTWTTDMTAPMDPFVTFNYSNFMRKYVDNKLQNVPNKAGEYGVLVLKVKMDESVAGNFFLHYAMGRGGVVDGKLTALPDYDAQGTGDYEYIIFDLSYTEFMDDVIGSLRFDWVDNNPSATEENIGASMTLYEINLYKDMDEAMAACGMEVPTKPQETKPQETEPQATEPQATEPQATEPTEPDDKGCKSVIASASVMTVVVAACAAMVLKKKKED